MILVSHPVNHKTMKSKICILLFSLTVIVNTGLSQNSIQNGLELGFSISRFPGFTKNGQGSKDYTLPILSPLIGFFSNYQFNRVASMKEVQLLEDLKTGSFMVYNSKFIPAGKSKDLGFKVILVLHVKSLTIYFLVDAHCIKYICGRQV